MEILSIALFSLALLFCLILDVSINYALIFGFIVFFSYSLIKGHSFKETLIMAKNGTKTVYTILITFILIGFLTSSWRASGTIPVIVCYSLKIVTPKLFVLMTFLLTSLMSVLTGTAFGSGATMGVICATIGKNIGIDINVLGGVIVAGAYLGDRCSPASTSLLLTSNITKTNLFDNLSRGFKDTVIPFIAACIVYTYIGYKQNISGIIPNVENTFSKEYTLSLICILPAIAIMVLALLKVKVKMMLTISILCALPICYFIQDMSVGSIINMLFFGFKSKDSSIASMLNGGGVLSMINTSFVVCITSAYSGIFKETKMMDNLSSQIEKLKDKTTKYIATTIVSLISGAIACNQTLAIILANQLCGNLYKDEKELSLDIMDSATVIPPLLPWAIACSVPLTLVGASKSAVIYGCYLYFIIIYRFAKDIIHGH